MGLAQDVHAAVTRYRSDAVAVIRAASHLASKVTALGAQLTGHGPLGSSADPDLARARACCTVAVQRLLTAAEAAAASGDDAQSYADRAFPR